MAGRPERLEEPLGPRELLQRLIPARLLEQRAAEDEMNVAALVEVVAALVENRERMPRLLLRELRRTTAQMHLRKRRDGLGGVGVVAGLERDRKRFLEVPDGDLGLSEQEAEATQVVDDARLGLPVA